MNQCGWSGPENNLCGESAWEDSNLCILHSDHLSKNVDAFIRRVDSKLQAKDYNFSGVIFPEGSFRLYGEISGADFSGARFASADFSGCKFLGPANFAGAQFLQQSDFSNAEFNAAAEFTSAEFHAEAIFFKTHFRGVSTFTDAKFNKASFYQSHFHGRASFRGAELVQARFQNATFAGYAEFAFAKLGLADYSVALFGDTADFSGTHFIHDADLYRATFAKAALFHTTKFEGTADLRQVKFTGEAIFSRAEFCGDARFDVSEFAGAVNFYRCEFYRRSSLKNARFSEDAHFDYTQFKDAADISEATFCARSFFSVAIFAKGVSFQLTKFEKEAEFRGAELNQADFVHVRFLDDADFEDAVFQGSVAFDYMMLQGDNFTGAVSFFEAYFGARLLLRRSRLHGAIDFSRATFAGPALFMMLNQTAPPGAEPIEIRFDQAVLEDPQAARFDRVDLRRTTFAGCNVRSVLFHACNWPRIRWRTAVYDEILGAQPPEAIRSLYRDLKACFEDARDWVIAGDFYYGEMEILRKCHRGPRDHWGKPRRYLSPYTAYWLTSGYAEKPLRAILVFGALILAFTLVFHKTTFMLRGQLLLHPTWAAALGHSVRVLTLQRSFFISPESIWAHRLTLLANLLGPLQLAQVAVAMQRRFRR